MDSKISLNLIKNWQTLCVDIVFGDIAALLIQNRVISVDDYQSIVSEPQKARVESLLLLLLKKDEKVLIKFGECLERDYSWLAHKLTEGCLFEEGKDETDASPITNLKYDKETENDTVTEDEKIGLGHGCQNVNCINRNNRLNNSFENKGEKLKRRKIVKSRIKNRLNPKIPNTEAVISSSTEIIKPVQNEEVTDEVIGIIRRDSLLPKSWTSIAHCLGMTDRIHDIRFKVIHYGEDLNMCLVYLIREWKQMFPQIATLPKLIEVLRSESFNAVADKLSVILNEKKQSTPYGVQ